MRKLILKLASVATLAAAATVMSIGPASAGDPACYSACGNQTNACHASCTWNQACHNQCTAIFNACMAACG
jgi:hypothetical protein